MKGGTLVREARLRAGLTQEELASRLHVSPADVERWEDGSVPPTVEDAQRAARACGLDLCVSLVPHDDHDLVLALRNLALTPEQRFDQFLDMVRFVEDMRHARRIDAG